MAPVQKTGKRSGKALTAAVLGGFGLLAAPSVHDFVFGQGVQQRPTANLRSRADLVKRWAVAADVEVEDAKAKLMDLLDDENVAAEVLRPEGRPMRGQVDEAILALEKLNPTEEPVYSELLDGEWKVKYAGSYAPGLLSSPTREIALFLYGGLSLGNALSSFAEGFWGQTLGVKQGEKSVVIKAGRDVEATAELEVNNQINTLKYTAELVPLSAKRMSEEVMSVELPEPIGSRDPPFEVRRSILVTYLDDTLMVARDESGAAEVLVRVPEAAPAMFTSSEPAPVASTGNATSTADEDDDGAQDPLSASAA
eukprot:TRINITY_DN18272_c0_g1_i1.p2 TRINITY_DN18272_c0_g1~~TRINITY_DN18272_c0_g1_i1.p2  ORF type:complete len:333 (-),score=100.46 TRINITY_DN18272_c0_g1_i1:455-1384(-)